ncbi:MAG: hypothetical protein LQ350_004144 [Teloschistes chrysophthalmus]|nr:MAG: hypothetical protein LQ350_004144 [Niorma chrysophthalma]
MPSNLRNSILLPSSTNTPAIVRRTSSLPQPPQKKQKMGVTQTYYLAHTARGKLSKEAGKADHDLRLLVGHANLLDGLMLDLADAEREQESWFNQTVKGASDEPKHIQWADSIEEAIEDDDEDSDSDSDSDDEPAQVAQPISYRRLPQEKAVAAPVVAMEDDSDDEMADDEDNDEEHALTRTSSEHPPELLHESSDSDSDDDMPPSPPQAEMPLDPFSQKQRQAIATTNYYPPTEHEAVMAVEDQASFFDNGFYIPSRQQHRGPGITAY